MGEREKEILEKTKDEKLKTESKEKANKYKKIQKAKKSKQKVLSKKKEKEYKDKIKKLEEETTFYKDQMLRKAAEFDNYKKRVERDILNITEHASEKLIRELLPVIDDIERTLKAKKDFKKAESVYSALEMIYNKLMKILKLRGLEPIDSVGKEFDTDLHEAMMVKEKKGTPSNIVLEEFEKGYKLNEKIIRHAKVVVSK